MTKEEHEKAFAILEKHFKSEVGDEDILNAWKLFKEDYVNQIEKLKKIEEYCESTKEKYKYYNECNTTDVRVISKIIKGDE